MRRGARQILILFVVISIAIEGVRLTLVAPPIPVEWFVDNWNDAPESRIARGGKLSLECSDIFALELLPGISDVTAANILKLKDRPRTDRKLIDAHGIGKKKSIALDRYLSVNDACVGEIQYDREVAQ